MVTRLGSFPSHLSGEAWQEFETLMYFFNPYSLGLGTFLRP